MLDQMVDQMQIPEVPGMRHGKPFEGYRISKENIDGVDVLRAVAFTGLDPASIYRDTGLTIGDFLPQFHMAVFGAGTLADLFSTETPISIADSFKARTDYNFTWNTKSLKAVKAVLSMKFVESALEDMGRGSQEVAVGWKLFSRIFRAQNSSMEVSFHDFQQVAETIVSKGLIPFYEAKTGEDAWQQGFPKPTKEEVSNIIAAVGNISGKTFGNLRQELLDLPPFIPEQMANPIGYRWDQPQRLVSPLFMFKDQLENVPEEMAQFKELGLAALATIKGIKNAQFRGEMATGGLTARGLDPLLLLPTEADIMAASAAEGVAVSGEGADPIAAAGYVMNNANVYVRLAGSEFKAAVLDGGLPEGIAPPTDAIPPPIVEGINGLSVTDEELAGLQDKWSEIFDVVRAAVPLARRAPMLQQGPVQGIFDYAVSRADYVMGGL